MNSRISTKHRLRNDPFQKELDRARNNIMHHDGLLISKNTLWRTALAVALMVGYLVAYTHFGVIGLVVLALLVLLAISHPFWLMK